MARYAYGCACGHETIIAASMGSAPTRANCEVCGRHAHRIYGFHFSEDRTRQFRNPIDGTRFSYSLGCEMPDNRRAYHDILTAKQCEPVTPGTMPEVWKAEQQYREHVMNGGERDQNFESPKPTATVGKSVLQQLRESNVRIPS